MNLIWQFDRVQITRIQYISLTKEPHQELPFPRSVWKRQMNVLRVRLLGMKLRVMKVLGNSAKAN